MIKLWEDRTNELIRSFNVDPPAKRSLAEAAIRHVYRNFIPTSRHPPKIVWCSSPLVATIAWYAHSCYEAEDFRLTTNRRVLDVMRTFAETAIALESRETLWLLFQHETSWIDSVLDRERVSQVPRAFQLKRGWRYGRVWGELHQRFGNQVTNDVRRVLRDTLRVSLRDHYGTVERFVDQALDGELLRLDERLTVPRSLWTLHWGVFDSVLPTRGVIDLSAFRYHLDQRHRGLSPSRVDWWRHQLALARAAYGCIYGSRHCFVVERPTVVRLNDESQLHATAQPAVVWPSGERVYAVHGVVIPGEWIERPHELTPKRAFTWRNVEQRRVACELIGWDNILNNVRHRTVDASHDPQIGTLLRVWLPGMEVSQFLRVRCGTGRTFAIPVPATLTSARQANAWTYGRTARDFRVPEVRT